HLEIFLAGAAIRASPRQRHVVPSRAGRKAFLRQALLLVVDEPADQAHEPLISLLLYCFHDSRAARRRGIPHFNSTTRRADRAARADRPSRGIPGAPRASTVTLPRAGMRPTTHRHSSRRGAVNASRAAAG